MHILAFILMLVVGSIVAASNGDFSGLIGIGKIVGGIIFVFALMWPLLHPVLLVIAIFILIMFVEVCLRNK